jgi:type VI secretion system protein VasI
MTMRAATLIASGLAITIGFHAQAATDLDKSIAKCAVLSGDLDRLQCFDEVAKSFGLSGRRQMSTSVAGTGSWQVRHDINPVDDSERVVMSLTAKSGTNRWGNPVLFVARCQSDKTEAYIVWDDYLGDDSSSVYREWKYVTIRIGDQKAKKQQWDTSTDGLATFAPDWAGDLLKEMATANTFLAQTTPHSESPVTAIFDTSGMAAGLQLLAKTCNWSSTESQTIVPKQDELSDLMRDIEELDRQRLSIGEVDALRRHLGRCWTLPIGVEGLEDMVVQLRIQVRPDRTVQAVTIQDPARQTLAFRAVAESARRAVENCSPLDLPPDKYDVWRDIIMNFYPEDAIRG